MAPSRELWKPNFTFTHNPRDPAQGDNSDARLPEYWKWMLRKVIPWAIDHQCCCTMHIAYAIYMQVEDNGVYQCQQRISAAAPELYNGFGRVCAAINRCPAKPHCCLLQRGEKGEIFDIFCAVFIKSPLV